VTRWAAWDDSSNNRAFLSGTISSTNNGASSYLEAKTKPDIYLTEKGTPMKDDIFHTRLPKGSAGGFIYPGPFSHMPMGYSKNQKAAKDFLRWVSSKDIFEQWFTSQQGFTLGPAAIWEEHAVWDIDPVMKPFKTLAHVGRMTGYAGPPGRPAAEGGDQIHYRRHVCEGDSRHAGRRCRQVGPGRARKDLRLSGPLPYQVGSRSARSVARRPMRLVHRGGWI
jgi:ABC-type glycerol-3-phosphate transport system substrate-binding protein